MNMARQLPAAALLLASVAAAQNPEVELLWRGGAPGAVGGEEADRPSLTIYRPAAPNPGRMAVVVCPGGGYQHLAVDHEGRQIAEWLNGHGIAAFVLRYRIAPRYYHPAPIQDAQRALRMARSRADEFGVAAGRIGIWGFSAGGHLASTAATRFQAGDPASPDPVERVSSRPDFAVLAYPVISFTTEYAHQGSRRNLLGEDADPKLVASLSSEAQVTKETPPVFLFHTNEDTGVPPENSVLFYLALRKHGIPAEMHIYEPGKHGVGLARDHAALSTWGDLLLNWFRTRGWLE
ncbi:MAG: alpha/beta hydrolase [Bryobacteraceae bacterium]|nr:alpha/beta hydrolase [Bryobacteraceae bacterium]